MSVHFFNNMSTSVNGGPYVRLAYVPICYRLEIFLLLEEKMFEIADVRRTDAGAWLYYKLTFGSGELK